MGLRLDEWKERYENKEIVNIKNEFTINELALLQKLGVELMDKLYTEREFEILDMKVISYYYDDTMSDEEKAECIPLPEGVSREEYNKLTDKIHEINLKYGFIIYIVLLVGTIIVFGRQMLHDFKIFKEYFREYNILILKTWGKALVTIIIINLIIQIFTNESSATNQKNLQEMFNILPIAVAALSIIYAPIVEESLFRGVIRKFINNKYLYIIFSGVLFGALHVIDDFQTVQELLYIFVYSALGMYLASLYYKTNNICTNMYMHFLQNTLSVVGMLLLKFMI